MSMSMMSIVVPLMMMLMLMMMVPLMMMLMFTMLPIEDYDATKPSSPLFTYFPPLF